jgi:creatinine amidohydrolase
MTQSDGNLEKTIHTLTGGAPVLWEQLTWPETQDLLEHGMDMCLLPVGATEQHGPHLPLNTDSFFASATCMYASARTGVPVLPTISYGCSLGHTDKWPGTISLFPETLIATVREIAGFLRRTRFTRLLMVNSHWGNTSSLRCALDRLRSDHVSSFQIGLKNSFEMTPSIAGQFSDDAADWHANRAETALMMFLDPGQVRPEAIEDDPDRTAGKVFTYVVSQTSKNGVTGRPSRASAEDGRRLFVEMGEALADFVAAARTEKPPLEESQ